MSIVTGHGDGGQTGLAGGARVSKAGVSAALRTPETGGPKWSRAW